MKRINLAILVASTLIAACSSSPVEDPVDPVPSEPEKKDATVLSISESRFTFQNAGATATVSVNCDGDWTASADVDWLTVEAVDTTAVKITVTGALDDNEDRKATVTVSAGVLAEYITVKLEKALLFDLEFDEVGNGTDASASSFIVQSNLGGSLSTYYNEDFGKYVAHFSHKAGEPFYQGYYKLDISTRTKFNNRLADGFSMEAVVSANSLPEEAMYAFGCLQKGGCALGVTENDLAPGFITWVDNKRNRVTGKEAFETGRYYHLVGVFDPEEQKIRCYVDGELVATTTRAKQYTSPMSQKWICFGGTCGADGPEYGWNGDLVTAKIYDAVFDDAEVMRRYEASGAREASASKILLDDVCFLPVYRVLKGGKMNFYADGLQAGDVIEFASQAGGAAVDCSTEVKGQFAFATLPEALADGTYNVLLKRGSEVIQLGATELMFVEKGLEARRPEIVCHRGVHNTGQPENSIAGLALAQEGGYYGSECDVWLTTDDSLMMNHDGVIGGKTLRDNDYATMRAQKLGNGEPLPTLREFLEQLAKDPDLKLVIEIKEHGTDEERTKLCAQKSMELVNEMGLQDHVEYITFSLNTCRRMRELDPDAVIQYLNGNLSPQQMVDEKFDVMDYYYTVMFDTHPDWIDEGHRLGIKTNLWTVDGMGLFVQCAAYCADYISTDQPDICNELLDKYFPEEE